VLSYVKKKI